MSHTGVRRIGALDGIRGLAIAAVMMLHAFGAWAPGGAVGVDLFFVLSAYLITTIVASGRERAGAFSFRAFYARRARRLGPALAVWLVVFALPASLIEHQGGQVVTSTLAAVFFVSDLALFLGWHGIGDAYVHAWSLAVEEQFYLLWPATLVVGSRWFAHRRAAPRVDRRAGDPSGVPRVRRPVAVVAAVGLLGLAALVQVWSEVHAPRSYFAPWGHVVALAGGCLLAGAVRTRPDVVRRLCGVAPAWCALVVLAAVVLGVDHLDPVTRAVAFVVATVAALVLVAHAATRTSSGAGSVWAALREPGRGAGIVVAGLELAWLRWLGRRSYALYLYHRTLASALGHLFPAGGPALGALGLLIALALAEVSWRLVESPVLRGGARREDRLVVGR